MNTKILILPLIAVCSLAMTACEISDELVTAITNQIDNASAEAEALAGPPDELPVPLSSVKWLSPNVSGWSKTSTLSPVTFGSGLIYLRYDKTAVWPNNQHGLNANAWIFILKDGTWYAATFEYMRAGYTTRGMNTINTAHLKQSKLSGWVVQSGVSYGWMVSGLARGGNRNVQERTNIKMATWP